MWKIMYQDYKLKSLDSRFLIGDNQRKITKYMVKNLIQDINFLQLGTWFNLNTIHNLCLGVYPHGVALDSHFWRFKILEHKKKT